MSIKPTSDLESFKMSSQKAETLCIFILVMMLVNISRAKLPEQPLLRALLFPEIVDEKFNKEGESLITGRPLESDFSKISLNKKSGSPNAKNAKIYLLEKHSTNLSKIETTSELETSTQSAAVSQNVSASSAPICNTPGVVRAHESDCRKYYNCSSEGSLDGTFHLIKKTCPKKLAFNIELQRCSRDISSCPLNINCKNRENIADPASTSSYYLCEPRLIGPGYRIFHVNCGKHEVYYWASRNCYVDLEYLPFYNWNQPKDIDVVKAELKQLRKQDKLKLKANEKLQQENKKKAIENAKQEAKIFKCVNEGNFASKIGGDFFITCIKKKNKLEAISMQCGVDGTFYPEFSTCVYSTNNNYSSIEDEEDEDLNLS